MQWRVAHQVSLCWDYLRITENRRNRASRSERTQRTSDEGTVLVGLTDNREMTVDE